MDSLPAFEVIDFFMAWRTEYPIPLCSNLWFVWRFYHASS